MTEEFEMLQIDETEPEYEPMGDAMNHNLIDALHCEHLHPRVWYLYPDDYLPFHYHYDHDELFYVIRGPGQMRIGDELIDVREGAFLRPHVHTPRQVLNDTGREHVWLIVGAPAVFEGAHIAEKMVKPTDYPSWVEMVESEEFGGDPNDFEDDYLASHRQR